MYKFIICVIIFIVVLYILFLYIYYKELSHAKIIHNKSLSAELKLCRKYFDDNKIDMVKEVGIGFYTSR